MGERLVGNAAEGNAPAKPFGQFDHQIVRYYVPRPMQKRYKLIILLVCYLVIGLILALVRR